MDTFAPNSSFTYAGGPLLVVCLFLGWTPFFLNDSLWNDANLQDPIKSGLKSSLYSHALIAGVAAALPPYLELIFYSLFSQRNSVKRPVFILLNIFIFISPEIISFLLILPRSDSKLYYLLLNNTVSASLFLAMLLLCQFSEKLWKCKLSTVSASFIYLGSLVCILAPYSTGSTRIWIGKFGSFLQFIGCIIFIIQAYKFLSPNSETNVADDVLIVDHLLCKYITLSVLFVIIGMFFVYLGAGLPYWTQWNSTYITCYSLILAVPKVAIGVAFAHATRNETIFLQQVKQMFINYISHEMRTPLNTAVMGLQYLRNELNKIETSNELITILDEVSGACEISVTILSEMLDFDKLQSGLMTMEIEKVPIKEFLEDTISPFYLQANAKDISLNCNLNDISLLNLLANIDKSKFAQVIRNLLSNALKFTPVGGIVTITTTVVPNSGLLLSNKVGVVGRVSPTPDQLLTIQVIDSGAGISKENQKKLFKEMVQFNPGKLQSGGGSGLGLYISKGIMDLLHGTLSIYSEGEGHGCTFTVSLLAHYDTPVNVQVHDYSNECGMMVEIAPAESTRITNHNSSTGNLTKLLKGSLFESSTGSILGLLRSDRDPPSLLSSSTSSKVVPLLPQRSESTRSTSVPSLRSLQSHDGTILSNDVTTRFRVMVVDDSSSNRKMLVRLLRDRCAVIDEAVDGIIAVNRLLAVMHDKEQKHYDAILLDYIMPKMEGPEAAREMRKIGYMGLIIGITGNVLLSEKEKFLSHGADLVLTKPINISDIDAAFIRIPTSTIKTTAPAAASTSITVP